MVTWLRHIRYHGVLLWNGVTFHWSCVGSLSGTCSAPGSRMRTHDLVKSLLIAQTTWFGIFLIIIYFIISAIFLQTRIPKK